MSDETKLDEHVPTASTPSAPTDPLLRRLVERFPNGVLATSDYRGDVTATLRRDALLDVMRLLRDDEGFGMLLDATAVDFLGRSPRFEVVYHLVSIEDAGRVRIKVPLEESDLKIPSLSALWESANWLEREAFDMYGIDFSEHPNLKRIYLYEEFVGHPLRKDYPKERRQPLIGPGAISRSDTVEERDG